MEKEKFNKNEYINNWKREHKKQFKVELDIDEYDKLNNLLIENNLTKASFVRKSMKMLEENCMNFLDLGTKNLKEYINDRINYYENEDYKDYKISNKEDLYKIACDYLEDKLYSQNLTNGDKIKYNARDVLLDNFKYNLIDIFRIKNIDKIGLIEYIRNNQFDIIENDDGTISIDVSNYE